MLGALCPRCGEVVAIDAGRPRITAAGAIELWCAPCFALGPTLGSRAAPAPRAITDAPPGLDAPPRAAAAAEPAPRRAARGARRRRARWLAAPAAGLIAAGALAAATLGRGARAAHVAAAIAPPAPPAPLADDVDDGPPPARVTSQEAAAPARHPRVVDPDALDHWQVPDDDGVPLDQRYPSLAAWIHPVVDSPEPTPAQSTRWFGAARQGITPRPECGEGHCGVDLDGPRGRPIVAVADGTVVRVEHSELGRDKRSGRYVRIEHDDGTLTAYMHLDDIALGLEVGDRVVAGEQIGTLGATAVYQAAPHLHFALSIPDHHGTMGDNNDNHYADPMPFLARAKVIDAPDRRRSRKANW